MRRLVPLVVLALLGLPCAARSARADDVDAAVLLGHPEDAPDPNALRIAAEDVLEKAPKDGKALRALLMAVSRMRDCELLDDAIERSREAATPDAALHGALGVALIHRARLSDPLGPTDLAMLAEAEKILSPDEGPGGDPSRALELAYARHLLGSSEAAVRAYVRALDGSETTADLAMRGLHSLLGGDDAVFLANAEKIAAVRPKDAVLLRWRAERMKVTRPADALTLLMASRETVRGSPRACLTLAGLLRNVDRHAEAYELETLALSLAGTDMTVVSGVEVLWREARPIASFADCEALDADFQRLFLLCASRPDLGLAFRNDLGFRFREVCATYAWRGEGRNQGIAEGAPAEARALLSRSVALYEDAVALVPKDAMALPFESRWTYASVLNDAALMRHYWTDVRDLDRAETYYLRAFELTDGAYMDTYDYNLQYLYGIEKPGNEARWFRLAQRASVAILKEAPGGGFVPDERKREAARKDAEGLRRLLEDRAAKGDGK